MDKGFIDNLHSLVLNHLADENFGVGDLASHLDLSTSQTLKKVKVATGKSVNQYIREVKLAEAAKLIRETDFTSAEISYKVGFSSPSYFNKTFRKHYGITPGGYKAQESIQIENDFIKDSIVNNATQINKKSIKRNLILISSILVLLLATTAYYFYQNPNNKTIAKTSETIVHDKSIAILPFKNLSSNKENEYFADGIMEVILNHLTSIKELKVISRTSMEQYRKTTKTMPEIAKELGVSYILEASVQKDNDEIRIITQLIDAKNDKHIWSTDIKKEYKDIFELQSTIAKQISKELNMELSDAEHNQIDKKPTNNLEAYNLYLKGVHFIRNGSPDKSIPYLEQAIEKDPEFAGAYSYLAVAHKTLMNLGTISPSGKNIKKIKELAQKAIALDNSIGQPHHVLALLLFRYDYNWKAAEKEFLIALKLDPKNPFTHSLYSQFLYVTGRIEESREHINKAQILDPVYFGNYLASAYHYYNSGDYEKALSENKKALELSIKFNETNWLNFRIYIAQKQYDKAIIDLKKLMNENVANEIDTIYKQFGIKGIYKWFIMRQSKNENHNTPYYIAQNYAFIGEHEKALEQLEKSFEREYHIWLVSI